jgi:hypothetical protein
VKFNEDYLSELGKSAPVRRLVEDATDRVLDAARANAPVDTGAYRAGLHKEIRETPYRVVGVVVGDDPKTMLIESKTGNLAKALRAAERG